MPQRRPQRAGWATRFPNLGEKKNFQTLLKCSHRFWPLVISSQSASHLFCVCAEKTDARDKSQNSNPTNHRTGERGFAGRWEWHWIWRGGASGGWYVLVWLLSSDINNLFPVMRAFSFVIVSIATPDSERLVWWTPHNLPLITSHFWKIDPRFFFCICSC